MDNMSMLPYEVTGLDLIPQRQNWSCWYASARMIINWKNNNINQESSGNPDELDAASRNIRDINSGITNPQVIQLAQRMGFSVMPPMSVTPNQIGEWLRMYGPLWVNGTRHIVVIAGISDDMVKVYDPWPVGSGKIDWRSLTTWYEGSSASSRDLSSGTRATFLYLP